MTGFWLGNSYSLLFGVEVVEVAARKSRFLQSGQGEMTVVAPQRGTTTLTESERNSVLFFHGTVSVVVALCYLRSPTHDPCSVARLERPFPPSSHVAILRIE